MNPGAALARLQRVSPPAAVTPAPPGCRTRPHLGRQHLARRLPDLGAQTQPRAELLAAGPLAHVRADLAQQHQRRRLLDPLDRCQVQPSSPGTPPAAHRNAGRWPCGFPPAYLADAGRRLAGVWILQRLEVRLDLLVIDADLSVVELPNARPPASTSKRCSSLPGPLQKPGGDLLGVLLATAVAQLRQPGRIAFAGHCDGLDNAQAGLTRDVRRRPRSV